MRDVPLSVAHEHDRRDGDDDRGEEAKVGDDVAHRTADEPMEHVDHDAVDATTARHMNIAWPRRKEVLEKSQRRPENDERDHDFDGVLHARDLF